MFRVIIILGLLGWHACFGQQNIGWGAITNYTKQTYKGGTQNWRIAQDKNNFVYFANNDGLISFDGTFWDLYALPNKTIVRSLAIGNKERIYVGGQGEIGYFSPGVNGVLLYHDLKEKLPLNAKNFDDVWEIVTLRDQVFFRVRNKIFHLSGDKINYFETGNWRFLGECNNTIYAQDLNKGLLRFENGNFQSFLEGNYFNREVIITGITPFNKDTILIATLQHGLFLQEGNNAFPLNKAGIQASIPSDIYCIQALSTDQFAIGTSNTGLFIINSKGDPIYHYTLESGLQNQGILSLAKDKTGNIWLGLENGIDYIAHNDPIRQIWPQGTNMGAGHTAFVKNKHLFLGTNEGLYKIPLHNTEDLSLNPKPLKIEAEIKGQVWSLTEINNQLLMGHHLGAYELKDDKWVNQDNRSGYWDFIPLQNVHPATKMVGGTYRGVTFFEFKQQARSWQKPFKVVPFESSRFIIRFQNDIWVSHPYKGIFKITSNQNYPDSFLVKNMGVKEGIKHVNKNYIFKIKNSLIAATQDGIFQYDETRKQFIPSAYLDSIIPFKNVRFIKEDPQGNLWIIYDKSLAVVDFEDENIVATTLPEFTNNLLSGFEFMYFYNQQNIILAAEKGFYLFNYQKYKSNTPSIKAFIRKVKVIRSEEQIIFAGFPEINMEPNPLTELKSGWKNIHFDFSAPSFGQQQIVEYSVQLQGYDKSWSAWSKRTDKEYTYLPAGDYTFQVRAKDNLGKVSEPAIYNFSVLPPWYLSQYAYLLYLLLSLGLFYFFKKHQDKTILTAHKKHQQEQERLKYLQQLEMDKAEKELVKLRNEKLETELELQNAELASATMHLVQKAEIINGIKEEMLKLTRNYKGEISIPELKKLIRTLGDDEAIDSGWDQFAQHFDKVHSNFHANLKAKYPGLTSSEMKLCTYLRMNLSSKEISQLLHITAKSVELSRYRLRKKLEIPHGESLPDFLNAVAEKE